MSKKNKGKKFSIPRRLIYIATVVLFVLIALGTWLGVTINNNQVKPFEDELVDVDYKVIKPNKLKDFTFDMYCADWFATSPTKAVFYCTAYDKASDNGKITNVNVEIILASNWTGYATSCFSGSLDDSTKWWDSENHAEDDTDPYKSTQAKISVSSEDWPQKSFLGFKVQPKAYVWLSYTTTKNGKSTDHNYIIVY